MDFEAYLISKKIDSAEFFKAEPELWETWKTEFDLMHPASFTAQKLYLINPVRRKYLLKTEPPKPISDPEKPLVGEPPEGLAAQPPKTPSAPKPAIPRPVFKPKPKTS